MCGRAACTLGPEEIQSKTNAKTFEGVEDYKPSYNIAPHQLHVVLLLDDHHQPILKLMRWGLVPSWSKDGQAKMHTINARAESLTTNNMWRGVVKRKRCVVLVSGYFEWTTAQGHKVPFYIHHNDPQQLICLAGMYDVWTDSKTGEKRYTCTVVTTESSPQLSHIHDRMPVILDGDEEQRLWLSADGNDPSNDVLRLLRSYRGSQLAFDRVSTLVNSIKNNSPECVVPVKELDKKQGILSFFKREKKGMKEEEETVVKKEDVKEEEGEADEAPRVKTEAKEEEDEPDEVSRKVKSEPEDDDSGDEDDDDGEDQEAEAAAKGNGKRAAAQRSTTKHKKRRIED